MNDQEAARMFRVLNLGAGVQSTTIYLMIVDGEIESVDVAIFADTGAEPAAVYEHLEFLRSLGGPEIVTVSAGDLGHNLTHGVNGDGGRFVSIPTFLALDGKAAGVGRRQCTREYKIAPIETAIRRMCGAAFGQPLPRGVEAVQLFGLSFDEPRRVALVHDMYVARRQWHAEFPLFDAMMTRADCVAWLGRRLPGRSVPRSACVFCPYHSDAEWLALRRDDPAGWQRAVEVDKAIRDRVSASTRGLEATQYLHRSCKPLEVVELRAPAEATQKRMSFADMDCDGMCGV